jgi:hypothetical protein
MCCRLWFNLGIIAAICNVFCFAYLIVWLPYVEVSASLSPERTAVRFLQLAPFGGRKYQMTSSGTIIAPALFPPQR